MPALRVRGVVLPDGDERDMWALLRRVLGLDADWFFGGIASLAPGVRMAHEAGVRVLAGTDSLAFGDVVTEVEWLMEIGPPPTAAIGAASWDARSYLGFPGLAEGARADVVAYPEDPRVVPGVLRHPSRVILRGAVVR